MRVFCTDAVIDRNGATAIPWQLRLTLRGNGLVIVDAWDMYLSSQLVTVRWHYGFGVEMAGISALGGGKWSETTRVV